MRVAVTGASGYLGRHVTFCLIKEGHDIIRVDLRPVNAGQAPTDRKKLAEDVRGADVMVHLAAQRDGPDVETTNVLLARQAVELAHDVGARRFIHMSSAGVYGRKQVTAPSIIEDDSELGARPGYETSKLRAEMAIEAATQAFGIQAIHLRPVAVFGKESEHCLPNLRRLVARRLLLLPFHAGMINFVHVVDVAEVTARFVVAARVSHSSYLLSDSARIRDVADVLSETYGRGRRYREIPDPLFDLAGQIGDLLKRIGLVSPLTSAVVTAVHEPYTYVSKRLHSEFGSWPFMGWASGLRECAR